MTFRTQIVFADFQKISLLKKMFTARPKHYFLSFFEMLLFHFFIFLSVFLQHKKDKNRKCIFFRKICLKIGHLDNLQKHIFAPLHTICDFKKYPKTLQNWRKQNKAKSWTMFHSTAYIYVYIYIDFRRLKFMIYIFFVFRGVWFYILLFGFGV